MAGKLNKNKKRIAEYHKSQGAGSEKLETRRPLVRRQLLPGLNFHLATDDSTTDANS